MKKRLINLSLIIFMLFGLFGIVQSAKADAGGVPNCGQDEEAVLVLNTQTGREDWKCQKKDDHPVFVTVESAPTSTPALDSSDITTPPSVTTETPVPIFTETATPTPTFIETLTATAKPNKFPREFCNWLNEVGYEPTPLGYEPTFEELASSFDASFTSGRNSRARTWPTACWWQDDADKWLTIGKDPSNQHINDGDLTNDGLNWDRWVEQRLGMYEAGMIVFP